MNIYLTNIQVLCLFHSHTAVKTNSATPSLVCTVAQAAVSTSFVISVDLGACKISYNIIEVQQQRGKDYIHTHTHTPV